MATSNGKSSAGIGLLIGALVVGVGVGILIGKGGGGGGVPRIISNSHLPRSTGEVRLP